jgi:catechol 2,3-dioxygenase-like lactoylglutathione lyase family enzyme
MGSSMLESARVEATVTTAKLDLARTFYEGPLGLNPTGSHKPGVDVIYELGGGTRLLVIEEPRELTSPHSAAHFRVDDVAATVRELRARGIEFDEFDLPGLKTEGGVAAVGDRHFAWCRDPDNNVLGFHD